MKTSAKGKHQTHDQKKEDHLAPTKIQQDNKPDKDQGKDANLTHRELESRLDLYSRIGGQKDQYFKVQAIKQKYGKEVKEIEARRTKADIYYSHGIRRGLPHAHHDTIKYDREQTDQKLRNKITQEAKSYYSKNNSLSKSFQDSKVPKEGVKQVFDKARDKGTDRER